MTTNMAYENGYTVTVYVNWSEASYRKPMMKLEFVGSKGKIIADFYGLNIFLTVASDEYGIPKGWTNIPSNTIINEIPFYVRGVGYTKQLYDFANAIKNNNTVTICSFGDAVNTQLIIHKIFENCKIGE